MDVERETVVDAPQLRLVSADEAVARLAVGVVGDEVEERDALQLAREGVANLPVVYPAGGLHVELHRADTVRPIADHDGRHEIPPEHATDQERRVLPAVERSGGEVPEWDLAVPRLVDRDGRRVIVVLEANREGVVRAPGHEFAVGDTPVPEEVEDDVIRGTPSASIGWSEPRGDPRSV